MIPFPNLFPTRPPFSAMVGMLCLGTWATAQDVPGPESGFATVIEVQASFEDIEVPLNVAAHRRAKALRIEYQALVDDIAFTLANPDAGGIDLSRYPAMLTDRGYAGMLDLVESVTRMLGGRPQPIEADGAEEGGADDAGDETASADAPSPFTSGGRSARMERGTLPELPAPPAIPAKPSARPSDTARPAPSAPYANTTPPPTVLPRREFLSRPPSRTHSPESLRLLEAFHQELMEQNDQEAANAKKANDPKGRDARSKESSRPEARDEARLRETLKRQPDATIIERDFPQLLSANGPQGIADLVEEIRAQANAPAIAPPPVAPNPATAARAAGGVGSASPGIPPKPTDEFTAYWNERKELRERLLRGHAPPDPLDFPTLMTVERLSGFTILCRHLATQAASPPLADRAAYWHERDMLRSLRVRQPKHPVWKGDYPSLLACDGAAAFADWSASARKDATKK